MSKKQKEKYIEPKNSRVKGYRIVGEKEDERFIVGQQFTPISPDAAHSQRRYFTVMAR